MELVAGLLLPEERTAYLAVGYVPRTWNEAAILGHLMTYRGAWQNCLWTAQS